MDDDLDRDNSLAWENLGTIFQKGIFMRDLAVDSSQKVTPQVCTTHADFITFDYIQSTDQLFNDAQFELMGAIADYKVSLSVHSDDPRFDALTAVRHIGHAIARQINAANALENAREALAKNLIDEINVITP